LKGHLLKQEDCFYCGYTVFSGARVCGHCNAHRVAYRDKSFGARIVGAVKAGFVFFALGFIVDLIAYGPNSDGSDFTPVIAILFIPIGVLWGLFRGSKNTEWRR
jgi:hypothetical protein